MNAKLKKVLMFVGGTAIVLVVGFLIFLGVIFYRLFNNPFNDRKFDRGVWSKYHDNWNTNNPRGQMAEDLKKQIEESKMTRAEVRSLLGSAEITESDSLLSYILGYWSGLRVDHDSFDIYFDSSGHVTRVEIYQH